MKRCIVLSILSIVLIGALGDSLGQNNSSAAVTGSAAFESLKKLAGEWQGTMTEKDKGPQMTLTYRLTANGSALIETIFPGTEHEMVTVYHMNGNELVLTHYCAGGNQPQMELDKTSTAQKLVFNFSGGTNLNESKDAHMHSGRIALIDENSIECSWDGYQEGKKTGENKFYLSRKK